MEQKSQSNNINLYVPDEVLQNLGLDLEDTQQLLRLAFSEENEVLLHSIKGLFSNTKLVHAEPYADYSNARRERIRQEELARVFAEAEAKRRALNQKRLRAQNQRDYEREVKFWEERCVLRINKAIDAIGNGVSKPNYNLFMVKTVAMLRKNNIHTGWKLEGFFNARLRFTEKNPDLEAIKAKISLADATSVSFLAGYPQPEYPDMHSFFY